MKGTNFWRLPACLAALAVLAGCNTMWGGIEPASYVGKEPPMTLLLAEYHGPDARNTADRVRDEMIEEGFKKTFVVADNDEAYLCHGLYKGFDDKSFHADRDRITAVRDRTGRAAFGRPTASPLPETTPPTPYDLTRANGKYTVQVGTFDLYGRKEAANQYAAALRSEGYEAYVYHGPTQSIVTIGAFGDIIFDNPYRRRTDPPQIISADVKRTLATFPYLNWNGHVFTEDELEKMTVRTKRVVYNTKTRSFEEVYVDTPIGEVAKSKLVHFPDETGMVRAPLAPTQPMPPGPMPSPRR